MIKAITDHPKYTEYEQRTSTLGRWRDRTSSRPYHFSGKERLRSGDCKQWYWRHRAVPAADFRPRVSRRDDARSDRIGDASAHKGYPTSDSCRHGDEERGREYHGPSHRFEDSRLSHQAGKPYADTPFAEEKHTPSRDSDGGDADWLSAEFPEYIHANLRLPDHRWLERRLSHTGKMGIGAGFYAKPDDRNAPNAEGRG